MSKQTRYLCLVACMVLAGMIGSIVAAQRVAESEPEKGEAVKEEVVQEPLATEEETVKNESEKNVVWKPAVEPKALSNQVHKGLDWLVAHQLESGAWGQGEESINMQSSSRIFVEGRKLSKAPQKDETEKKGNQEARKSTEIPSVADTCMATLALIRSGSTPSKGPYAKNIDKAVKFICSEIEASDDNSLHITQTRGTRVQSKLGPYVDTFMAAMLLPEVVKQMPNKEENQRVKKALEKVLKKMEINQREDGTWSDSGWAAALSQGAAVKGLNRAMQSGMEVPQMMQQKAESNARLAFDKPAGTFSKKGSAGVELYASSSNMSALADSVNSNKLLEEKAKRDLKEATSEEGRKKAQDKLKRFAQAEKDLESQQQAVIEKLNDERFIAGFGNNGGEEFLSYMNIGESLVVKGGNDWLKWDESITKNLNNVQNQDGSWSGHHCITGHTFCTSAALLVLMVDRAPFPVCDKTKRQQ